VLTDARLVHFGEGHDSASLGPNPTAWIKTPSGRVLKTGDPVVTYVARNLEP
jgi:hypothetical protein